eukprot:scaffold131063_cov43-Attheya_sp.AAC.2
MSRRTWQAVGSLEIWWVWLIHWKSRYDNRDVKDMAGCEWFREMVDRNVEEDITGCGWLGDMVGSVDSLEIKMSKA